MNDFAGLDIGGVSKKPAFCVLHGVAAETDGLNPFRIEIDRIPATLGRSHATSEPNFFGLGKAVKALSRYQCRIDYRVPSGALGQFTSSDEFTYRAAKAEELNNPTSATLPPTGIYAVTCLGKNPLRVNGTKIEQNETCYLPHGSTMKFSAFSVYFLLPSHTSTKTLELPLKAKQRKRKIQPDSVSSSPPSKKSKIPAFKTLQEELENKPTEDLLAQLKIAHEKGIWDRRCQFMGATISYRAVRDAAQSKELQHAQASASDQAPGISKQELVKWIEASPMYKAWTEIMQMKLEPKSYQTNIAKAMQRAGYERSTTVSVGRHVRWFLPRDICPRAEEEEEEKPEEVVEKETAEAPTNKETIAPAEDKVEKVEEETKDMADAELTRIK